MLKKNLVLGSVASLAVAVAFAPALAQSPPRYPNYSLPWEVAETTQLNAQQASEPGIIVSDTTASVSTPDTTGVVASTDNSADIVAYNQALANQESQVSQFNSQQSAYDSQLSDFNARQSSYQQNWQDYQNKLNAYNQQMSMWRAPATVVTEEVVTRPVIRERIVERPVVSGTVVAANDEWITIYPHHERLVVFETVTNPDIALRGTPVMDRSGNMVGTFQHMTLQDRGFPEALITLSDNKTVAVADQHLRYDPMAKIVVADLTFGQMDSMPARF